MDFDPIDLAVIARPPEWMKDARCVEYADKADWWFPERGAGIDRAKWVCTGCLVRQTCLRYALDENIREGVWGGLSPQERREVSRDTAA